MFRIGLSFYLVFAAAAGPGLCCCLPGRVANLLGFAGKRSQGVALAAPAKSCCHHTPRSTPDEQKNPAGKRDKPGCPDNPNCPCKQPASRVAIVGEGADQLHEALVRSLTAQPQAVVVLAPPTGVLALRPDQPGYGECTALPFLTPQDYLTALHLLLC
jgi:hypothetical protein